jgi:hypothetical protein
MRLDHRQHGIRVTSILAFAAALGLAPAAAHAQRCVPPDCVLINASLLRVGIGAEVLSLSELPNGTPARDGVGLYLRVGVPVVSGIYSAIAQRRRRQPGFTLYDDFYMELNPTVMYSAPLTLYRDTEGPLGIQFRFGWDIGAGWQMERLGLWGGIRLQWETTSLGGTSKPGLNDIVIGNYPLMVRADFAVTPNWHIIAMPWVSVFGDVRNVGAEVDIGLGGNFYLGFRVDHLYGGDVSLANSTAFSTPGGELTTGLIYLRAGREY